MPENDQLGICAAVKAAARSKEIVCGDYRGREADWGDSVKTLGGEVDGKRQVIAPLGPRPRICTHAREAQVRKHPISVC